MSELQLPYKRGLIKKAFSHGRRCNDRKKRDALSGMLSNKIKAKKGRKARWRRLVSAKSSLHQLLQRFWCFHKKLKVGEDICFSDRQAGFDWLESKDKLQSPRHWLRQLPTLTHGSKRPCQKLDLTVRSI